jgi:thymidylate synthase (FAD)
MSNGKIQVELQEWMGSDESIANAAWTSTYDKEKREEKYDDPEKIAALVPRLIREGHSTPIESVILRFWIRMPIFTDRQHMTHRVASHNGLSGRYRTMPSDFFQLPPDVLAIAEKCGQGCAKLLDDNYENMMKMQNAFYEEDIKDLKAAEKQGMITNAEYKRVREVFRGVLGTSFMVERTTIFNLRSFANYQRLRNSDHAQPEIKQVAVKMLEQVEAKGIAPIAIKTLKEIGWRI